jgi:Protein of unknown function (DUF3617)
MKVWTHTTPSGLAAVLVLSAFPFSLHAQGLPVPIKPGLWEMQASSASATPLPPEAEAKIAALPPAQQAQVRSMMGGGKPIVVTRQVCFAAHTSLDSLLSQAQHNPGMQCTFSNKAQTANGASFDMSCTGPSGSAQGHAEFHATDDEHMGSTIHMTVTGSSHGTTVNSTMDTTSTGKFLNADCGNVKPMGPPPQAQ